MFIAMEPADEPADLGQVWHVSRDARFLISTISGAPAQPMGV
jgi:hypothetical protein